MHEIEVKVLHINKAAMEKKILALGATKKGQFLIVEKFFDFKKPIIGHEKKVLRLRSVGGRVELAFKENVNNKKSAFKIKEETETTIGDFKTMEKIFNKVGLYSVKHREKYRTSFEKGPVKFEIDEYPGIPPYMEIEASQKDILKYLKLLGIPFSKTSNLSSGKVLKKYGVSQSNLRF